MPRAPRTIEQEQGGESGDPREMEQNAGSAMYGGPKQPLPPLQRGEAMRTFQQERRELLDAVPPAKRWRVVRVPRNADGMVQMVVVGGRQAKINEGKELDERYFDIPGLKRQGIKLELIDESAEAAAG
jgi:hypothetical protein